MNNQQHWNITTTIKPTLTNKKVYDVLVKFFKKKMIEIVNNEDGIRQISHIKILAIETEKRILKECYEVVD